LSIGGKVDGKGECSGGDGRCEMVGSMFDFELVFGSIKSRDGMSMNWLMCHTQTTKKMAEYEQEI
jgi:hypothetical protein